VSRDPDEAETSESLVEKTEARRGVSAPRYGLETEASRPYLVTVTYTALTCLLCLLSLSFFLILSNRSYRIFKCTSHLEIANRSFHHSAAARYSCSNK